MGTTKQERKPRKATFMGQTVKGVRQFTPVNKRAQKWAREVAGRRKLLTKSELKKIARKGKVGVYVYTNAGLRKAVV